ncbi:MAG: sigma-54-dependent Fis family transcriptional regulator [Deltaproteobacteria bacterium]|nr:sigma-54-dependent Fis family transcriptional regulator [Deltaproteobacteria bacterium]
MKILTVDDEPIALNTVKRNLRRHGLRNVEGCDNGREAIELIKQKCYDIVLLDLIMPEVNGLEVLKAVKPLRPSTEFIILSAMDDVPMAVQAIRLGAYDYLLKPIEGERLFLSIQRAYERKALLSGLSGRASIKGGMQTADAFSSIITRDLRMKELLSYAGIMARSWNSVLITGESGTGKELLAHGIHLAGLNPEGPFTAVNMACIPETLFETQFFGHVQGAFTGAAGEHAGYFERTNGGTLFLDEIGELPSHHQAKFLRVLEDKSVTRIGSTESTAVNVRIVSATNSDLDKACQTGCFRLDLLYRLKSVHIHLPPLRERREDIPLLASHFLSQSSTQHNENVGGFSPEAMDILLQRDFPGNIRELAQLVDQAVLLCDSDLILPKHLGEERASVPLSVRVPCTLKANEDRHLAYVLNLTKGNIRKASEILGVTARQTQRKVLQLKNDPQWTGFFEELGED